MSFAGTGCFQRGFTIGGTALGLAAGNVIMREGRAVGAGGTLLVTKDGETAAKNSWLGYQVVDLSRSKLYRGYR